MCVYRPNEVAPVTDVLSQWTQFGVLFNLVQQTTVTASKHIHDRPRQQLVSFFKSKKVR